MPIKLRRKIMALYIGDSQRNPVKIKDIYIGDSNNTPKKVLRGYIGDSNGNPQLFWIFKDEEEENLNEV